MSHVSFPSALPASNKLPAAASKLVERPTYDRDTGEVFPVRSRALIRRYPEGHCEVTVTKVGPSTSDAPKHRVVSATSSVRTPEQVAEDFAQKAQRARSTVRRTVMAGGLDHMLTLTYRENVTDLAKLNNDLTRFLRIMRREEGGYSFCAVLEFQKRGAGHWHLAVRGYQDVNLIRRVWRSIVGDGAINVRAWASGRMGSDPGRIAGYISKYITKSINDHIPGAHRYRRSRDIVVEEIIEEFDGASLSAVARSVIRRYAGTEAAYLFTADSGPISFAWAASWGSRSQVAPAPS